MPQTIRPSRGKLTLFKVAGIVLAALGVKVFLSILWEYRWYFPANFDESAFLTGRRETFTALYQAAFYAHLFAGPASLALAAWSMWCGAKKKHSKLHRWAGRAQAVLIFAFLTPTGLVMATKAFSGPIAGLGFVALSLATAGTMGVAIYHAIKRKFVLHQRWATRCFILLISPLILRVVSGGLIVTESWTETTYQLNAWLSWIIPWAIYELWRLRASGEFCFSPSAAPRAIAKEAPL